MTTLQRENTDNKVSPLILLDAKYSTIGNIGHFYKKITNRKGLVVQSLQDEHVCFIIFSVLSKVSICITSFLFCI